jgi:hypothetical protein
LEVGGWGLKVRLVVVGWEREKANAGWWQQWIMMRVMIECPWKNQRSTVVPPWGFVNNLVRDRNCHESRWGRRRWSLRMVTWS